MTKQDWCDKWRLAQDAANAAKGKGKAAAQKAANEIWAEAYDAIETIRSSERESAQ